MADDLTGANDVGIQFAKHHISTSVIFSKLSVERLRTGKSNAVIYDTETRNESPKEAYRRIHVLCSAFQKAGFDLTYKKIDSTLRGNLGVELQAILDSFKKSCVLVCPTYPEYKRTVVDGRLLVDGIPVDRTEFARDPSSPVMSSYIRTLIKTQISEPVDEIPLAIVRKGSSKISQQITHLTKSGIRIISVDAENRKDLKNIALASVQKNLIPCGSAGLAEEIAGIMHSFHPKTMILSATTNQATLRELQRMSRSSRVFLIKARVADLAGESRRNEIRRVYALSTRAVEKYDVILVCSALYAKDIRANLLSEWVRHDVIATGLAEATAPLVRRGLIRGVLLTGGNMAAAFLRQIRAGELRLEREILPGIPLCRIVSGNANGLKIATKAGGFGLKGCLKQIVDCVAYDVP
jgi:uncharacterized protein YgbK (DUF1537 family)